VETLPLLLPVASALVPFYRGSCVPEAPVYTLTRVLSLKKQLKEIEKQTK